jgi:hypothetical protein
LRRLFFQKKRNGVIPLTSKEFAMLEGRLGEWIGRKYEEVVIDRNSRWLTMFSIKEIPVKTAMCFMEDEPIVIVRMFNHLRRSGILWNADVCVRSNDSRELKNAVRLAASETMTTLWKWDTDMFDTSGHCRDIEVPCDATSCYYHRNIQFVPSEISYRELPQLQSWGERIRICHLHDARTVKFPFRFDYIQMLVDLFMEKTLGVDVCMVCNAWFRNEDKTEDAVCKDCGSIPSF